MTNPTSNFGWQMPMASDLVTDLPADFETFGQAVDTSLADLKGGTSGQVLSKASNTDMDFTWVAQDDSNAIQNAIVDAKGDLIAASAADTPARLAVGNNGETLVADSSTATGLKWTSTGQAATLISRTSFVGVSSQTFGGVFTSTYTSYLVEIEGIYGSTGLLDLLWQFTYGGSNTPTTTGYYANSFGYDYVGSLSNMNTNNGSAAVMTTAVGASSNCSFSLYVAGVALAGGDRPRFTGTGLMGDYAVTLCLAGQTNAAGDYNGFLLKPDSGTITGTVAIYGLAK